MPTDAQEIISKDIYNIDALIHASAFQVAALSAQAEKGFSLGDAISHNDAFRRMAPEFVSILDGYALYKNGGTDTPWMLSSYDIHFTSYNDYRGNLSHFTITDGINYEFYNPTFLANYTITGLPVLSGSTTVYVPMSTITFMIDQFSFINKYLWADPTNPALAPYLSGGAMSNRGVYYNATTLLHSATSIKSTDQFYTDKKKYLTPLTK